MFANFIRLTNMQLTVKIQRARAKTLHVRLTQLSATSLDIFPR